MKHSATPNDTAFPAMLPGSIGSTSGMTVRQFYVALAMQGILARLEGAGSNYIATRAIKIADEVLKLEAETAK